MNYEACECDTPIPGEVMPDVCMKCLLNIPSTPLDKSPLKR